MNETKGKRERGRKREVERERGREGFIYTNIYMYNILREREIKKEK